jgi:hypothetical protein
MALFRPAWLKFNSSLHKFLAEDFQVTDRNPLFQGFRTKRQAANLRPTPTATPASSPITAAVVPGSGMSAEESIHPIYDDTRVAPETAPYCVLEPLFPAKLKSFTPTSTTVDEIVAKTPPPLSPGAKPPSYSVGVAEDHVGGNGASPSVLFPLVPSSKSAKIAEPKTWLASPVDGSK